MMMVIKRDFEQKSWQNGTKTYRLSKKIAWKSQNFRKIVASSQLFFDYLFTEHQQSASDSLFQVTERGQILAIDLKIQAIKN